MNAPKITDPVTGRKHYNLTGVTFGRWTVLGCSGREQKPSGATGQTLWACRCECGNEKEGVLYAALVTGRSESCGCYRLELLSRNCKLRTHGMSNSKAYRAWQQMKDRCYNQSRRAWKRYGGRGIVVCERWLESFENFYSDMGEPPARTSLDRKDNNGNYEPGNCRWAGAFEQARNRHNIRWSEWKGDVRPLVDIARMENVAYCSFRNKVCIMGMTVEEAVRDCQARGLTYRERAKGKPPEL